MNAFYAIIFSFTMKQRLIVAEYIILLCFDCWETKESNVKITKKSQRKKEKPTQKQTRTRIGPCKGTGITVNPLINACGVEGVSIRRGRLFKNFISENRYYYKHETILHNINNIVIYSVFNKKIKAHIIFNRWKYLKGMINHKRTSSVLGLHQTPLKKYLEFLPFLKVVGPVLSQ